MTDVLFLWFSIIIVFPVIRRQLSTIFFNKRHHLKSHEADSYHISRTLYSIYRQGERIMALLSQSDKNSSCYGNLELSLTYNGKN